MPAQSRQGVHEDDGIPPIAACSFIVNACMGIGFLAIPHSANRVGLIPALVLSISICLVATLTAVWVATVLSFLSALLRAGDPEIGVNVPLKDADQLFRAGDQADFSIAQVRLPITKMVGCCWGRWAERISGFLITFCIASSMWAYAGLVSGSLGAMVPLPFFGGTCDVYSEWPECAGQYYGWLGIFAVVVLALSLLQLKEQRWFQVSMTFVRVILVLLVLGDCIRMLAVQEAPPVPGGHDGTHGAPLGSIDGGPPYDRTRFPEKPSLSHFDISHLPRHVAMITVAIAVHVVIPEAVSELEDKPRTLIPTLASAMLLCSVVYVLVGLIVPLTFGDWVHRVCTLNWANWTAGEVRASVFAVILRSFIILVPVVDVTAAYPVFAVTVTSTVYSQFCAASENSKDPPPIWLRLICAAVPLVGAALIFDIGIALSWASLCIGPFMFLIIPLMLRRTEKMCVARFGAKATHSSTYWRWFCAWPVVWVAIILGTVFYIVGAFSIVNSIFA